jgi:predicted DNA-binding transcriptional regulator YafY
MRKAIRSFRLDRIVELSLLDKTFQMSSDFNIREYLASAFDSEAKILVRLRFASQAAQVARDLGPTWDAFQEQADGSVVVSLKMPDLQWATSMALGFGPIVTVLQPAELRQTVRKWASAIAEQYERGACQT